MPSKNLNLDLAAARLEGLAPMPANIEALRTEKLMLDKQKEIIDARLAEIKAAVGNELETEGLNGFILNGKVHARLTKGTRTTVDGKRLKDELPHIYPQYLKVTPYQSITIN